MGKCYSTDQTAEDHIHTDITCNTEEPQQKYRFGRSVIDYWGGVGLKHVEKPDPFIAPSLRQAQQQSYERTRIAFI